jgi:hypothetical protein
MTRHLGFLTASLACALLALGLVLPAAAGAATMEEGALSAGLEGLQEAVAEGASPAAVSAAAGLPAAGPGSLTRDGEDVIVEVHFEEGALARVEALEAVGATVRVASAQYQTVALSVAPEDLAAVAAIPGVSSVAPVRRPMVYAEGSATAAGGGSCEGGSVISQGVAQLNVPAARSAFGVDGSGETVGVISDSFNSATKSLAPVGPIATHAAQDEATNDLPGALNSCSGQQTPVRVIAEAPPAASEEEEPTDEGRAMLQVVHDVAPAAHLAFATAEGGEFELTRHIERLAAPVSAGGAGADVIVDDVGYFTEPFYQDGPVAVAIRRVREAGVTYLTAAGNENIKDSSGRNIGSWEAPAFRPVACPTKVNEFLGEISTGCMDFNPTATSDPTFGVGVANGATVAIDMQWAEPWFGVKTDLDAYLFDEAGQVLSDWEAGEGDADSIKEQVPVELLGWKNETGSEQAVFLVIDRCAGACNPTATNGTPRLKFEFVGHGTGVTETEYPTSSGGDTVGPTIYGHAGAAAAISVGAIRYTESSSAPKEPETYSSRGPVMHYFAPVTSAGPAAPLGAPEAVSKPNLTATDCASTTFFARLEAGSWHFCGTSEAAPHAAGVAALMHEINPGASPVAIVAAMETSATKYTVVNSSTAVGAGLLNAAGALSTLGRPVALSEPPPTVTITKGPESPSRETRPTFEFTASRAASFTCQIDGGIEHACTSPYAVPSKLADGTHGFVVTGTDAHGQSGTSSVYDFTIDTKAPKTKFVRHPKPLVRTKKPTYVAHFRLRSDQQPVTFYCQFDKEALRICPKTFHRRFTPGRHVVKVRAKDVIGNIAATPTRFRFRVKQVRPKHRAKAQRPR